MESHLYNKTFNYAHMHKHMYTHEQIFTHAQHGYKQNGCINVVLIAVQQWECMNAQKTESFVLKYSLISVHYKYIRHLNISRPFNVIFIFKICWWSIEIDIVSYNISMVTVEGNCCFETLSLKSSMNQLYSFSIAYI